MTLQALIRQLSHESGSCGPTGPEDRPLSPGELRVATATIRGLDTKGVARLLHMSPKTTERHLTNIYRKLDVRTRQELAALVIRYLLRSEMPRSELAGVGDEAAAGQ